MAPPVYGRLAEVRLLVERTTNGARRSTQDLRADILDDMGLVAGVGMAHREVHR